MKPRYKVNLPQQQALCDANYLRLCKLMPNLEGNDHWVFIVGGETDSRRVSIQVEERAKYTTTVTVSQSSSGSLERWSAPELRVRLYHDARMAEVIAWARHHQLKVRYEYPNRFAYQCDEKAQFNLFLGEWLSHCLDQGRVLQDIVAPLGLDE